MTDAGTSVNQNDPYDLHDCTLVLNSIQHKKIRRKKSSTELYHPAGWWLTRRGPIILGGARTTPRVLTGLV